MSDQSPHQPPDKKPTPPRAEAADSTSLPIIDLGQEGIVDIGELNLQVGGSDIPLAQLPEPPSGQSLTTWTEVIRRQRAAQAAADAERSVEVDAPSDKDLLERLGGGSDAALGSDRSKQAGDTSEISQSQLPVFVPHALPASESDIDLGRAIPPGATGGSEIRFDILYPPSDAGGAMPLPALDSSSSGTIFKPAAAQVDQEEIPFAANPTPGMSGVDLGASIGATPEQSRSSILDVLIRESAGSRPGVELPQSDLLEFGEAPPAPKHKATMPNVGPLLDPPTTPTYPGVDRPAAPTQPGIELVNLDGAAEGAGADLNGPTSSFGSDEAVDLYADSSQPPSLSDSGTLEISEAAVAESQRKSEQLESSAIDLDSRPVLVGTEFDIGVAQGNSQSDSNIDLALPPIDDESASSLIGKRDRLDADSAALARELEARRQRSAPDDGPIPHSRASGPDIVPVRDDDFSAARRRGYLLHGGVLGLLLGAGAVLAAYFGGALPDRKSTAQSPGADNAAALAQLRQEAATAKENEGKAIAAAEAVRKSLTDAGIDPDKAAEAVKNITNAKAAADARVKTLTDAAQRASADLAAARKTAAAATLAETTAKNQLVEANKAVDAAKAEAVAAKKAGDEAVDTANKAQKAAEAKERDATAKLVDAAKREGELAKAVDSARKLAEDNAKARDTVAATLAAVSDRLAKAKYVGDRPDAAAIVKGIDDAIKAASSDVTSTLREDLVKARDAEAKLKSELTAAKEREASANKIAVVAREEANKLITESAKLKVDVEKLSRESAVTAQKFDALRLESQTARAETQRLAAEGARLKTDNERLTRDLEVVRELAELIRSQPAAIGSASRTDPARLADRFFADGLRAFHSGQFTVAEPAFRKAIQFRADDARYHYLLGLCLWMGHEEKAAEAAFEKGRDLEQDARPSSRAVSTALERIQGPARLAVNAYRP